MNSVGTRTAVLAAAAALLLSITSCVCVGERVELVDLRTEEHTVDLGDAESVVIDVEIGVGKLIVKSGSAALLDAEFTYNVDEWKPAVDYSVAGGKGRLSITQPDAAGKSSPKGARNEWVLTFSDDVPLELSIDMGVGEARMELGNLMLSDLSVDHGVGDLKIDLAGRHVGDLNASIDGGVGKIALVVPSSVGVRVEADTGIGSFRTHGLTKRGDVLVNDAYGETESTIRLSVDAGIGEITVETSDGTTNM
ncbi:MAG: toast rack family protein [Candidatus Eisenbacteria bacterium]